MHLSDYITKYASNKYAPEKKNKSALSQAGVGLVGGLAANTAVGLPLTVANKKVTSLLMKDYNNEKEFSNIKRLIKTSRPYIPKGTKIYNGMWPTKGESQPLIDYLKSSRTPGAYIPMDKVIYTNARNSHVLAHELGHASGAVGRALTTVPIIGAKNVGGLSAILAPSGSKAEKAGLVVYLAGTGVYLGEEARANVNAYKLLKKSKAYDAGRYRKMLLGNSSHLLASVAGASEVLVAMKLKKMFNEPKKSNVIK